jgi:hypothetical protein
MAMIPLTTEERNVIDLRTWSKGWLIQLYETLAVWFGLRAYAPRLRGRVVKLRIDSTTALAYVLNGGGSEPVKSCVAREILQWTAQNDVVLWSPEYIPSKENAADDPSRIVDRGDWTVQPWVFQECERRWGTHTVDRFADYLNAWVPRFNSKWWCPGAEAVDAFSQDWGPENNWVVAPFDEILNVLLHVQECQARATVIVPIWKGQPWWPLLQALRTDQWELVVRGPSGEVEPWANPAWRFEAVRVDGTNMSGKGREETLRRHVYRPCEGEPPSARTCKNWTPGWTP